jgi:hypothetical protein
MRFLGRTLTSATAGLLTLGLGGCAFPGDAIEDGEGILGVYSVNGVDPAGEEYSGTVTITATDDAETVRIEWIVTGSIQEGIGDIDGDTLIVEWTSQSSAAAGEGTAVYTIGDDGVLRGERTTVGIDGVGTEEIFPEA